MNQRCGKLWMAMIVWFGLVYTSAYGGLAAPVSEQPLPTPTRISEMTIPGQIAFIQKGNLWILNAREKDSQPIRVNQEGFVHSFSWSHDGQWLLFEWKSAELPYGGDSFLWVVRSNGQKAFQVDSKPLAISPSWSPRDNSIAYSTRGSDDQPFGEGKIARIAQTGSVKISSLYPASEEVVDMAWAPDGQSLAISLSRTKDRPLSIDRLTLKGQRTNLHTQGKPVRAGEGIYLWAASGLTWSPNGQFLAYFLEPNSGSLAADGVAIQLLDLKSHKTLNIGGGLAYPEWLAWSLDGESLAYIQGGPREAITSKRLYVLDTRSMKMSNLNQQGSIETVPEWSKTSPPLLAFLRGPDMKGWNIHLPQVLVPNQRVWVKTSTGKEQPVTAGKKDTADTMPALSPDAKALLYVRLFRYDQGSIFLKRLPDGKEIELIRGVSGDGHGYYGNYLPPWFQVYWDRAG